ncbi:MAG: lytic transglycosylase domain-containing protein [Geminicoccaceae bacterium]
MGGAIAVKGRLLLPAALLLLGAGLGPIAAAPAPAPVGQLLAAAERGDWEAAQVLVAKPDQPALRLYLRWRQLAEGKGTAQPPFAAYADFLERYRDWPSLGLLQQRAEAAIDGSVAPAERLRFFAGRAPRTKPGRLALAEALEATDQGGRAAEPIRASWAQDDFAAGDEAAFVDRWGRFLRPADDRARLDRLLRDGTLDQARRLLPRLDPATRALAQVRIKLQAGEPGAAAALAALPRELQADPGLRYDRWRWRQRQGDEVGARALLLDLPSPLPRPELWWPAQQAAIRDALDAGDSRLAYRLAAESRQTAGVAMVESAWLAGWLALRFNDEPALAAGHFAQIWRAATTPLSRAKGAYWLGRAEAARGRSGDSRSWYARAAALPQTYYGQLAAAEIGAELRDQLLPPRAASDAARAALLRRPVAQAALLLCGAGAAGPAQPLFRHLGHESAGDLDQLRAVLALSASCDRPDLGLTAVRAAAGQGTFLGREAFPLPRMAAFRQQDDGAPEPALLMALARQESLLDPAARSPAGALGLMQLMPDTAAEAARALDLPFARRALTEDPDLNVRLGAFYLQQQLDRFSGEVALALAAYNAGPRRVDTWLAAHGDPRGGDRYRLIDWIELIPFAETRNYVQRVLEGRAMYRAILAGPRPALPRTAADTAPRPRLKPAS